MLNGPVPFAQMMRVEDGVLGGEGPRAGTPPEARLGQARPTSRSDTGVPGAARKAGRKGRKPITEASQHGADSCPRCSVGNRGAGEVLAETGEISPSGQHSDLSEKVSHREKKELTKEAGKTSWEASRKSAEIITAPPCGG